MLTLLAQNFSTWGIGQWAIAIVVVAAIAAIVFLALRKFGVTIPDWIVQIFWILVVAVACVGAIKFLMGL